MEIYLYAGILAKMVTNAHIGDCLATGGAFPSSERRNTMGVVEYLSVPLSGLPCSLCRAAADQ
jgi:hypothetical protein